MLRQPLLCRKLVIFRFMLWNAYVGGGFHLELVHRGASLGDHDLVVAGRLIASHNNVLLCFMLK